MHSNQEIDFSKIQGTSPLSHEQFQNEIRMFGNQSSTLSGSVKKPYIPGTHNIQRSMEMPSALPSDKHPAHYSGQIGSKLSIIQNDVQTSYNKDIDHMNES